MGAATGLCQQIEVKRIVADQVEAMTLADKIVVLRGGNIEQVGAPLDLYKDPDNKFVAGFIGSPAMNFLEGTSTGDAVEVPALKGSFNLPVNIPAAGTKIILGVRPEHIEVDRSADALAVELTEALGGVSYDYLMSDTGEKIIVEEHGDERSTEGSRVGIKFDPDRAMLFDGETEARIR